jgi:hypothetical protein
MHTFNTLWSSGHYLDWREIRELLSDPSLMRRLIRVDGPTGATWPAFQIHEGYLLDGVGREPEIRGGVWYRIDWWTRPRTVLDGASVANLVRAGAEFDEIAELVEK